MGFGLNSLKVWLKGPPQEPTHEDLLKDKAMRLQSVFYRLFTQTGDFGIPERSVQKVELTYLAVALVGMAYIINRGAVGTDRTKATVDKFVASTVKESLASLGVPNLESAAVSTLQQRWPVYTAFMFDASSGKKGDIYDDPWSNLAITAIRNICPGSEPDLVKQLTFARVLARVAIHNSAFAKEKFGPAPGSTSTVSAPANPVSVSRTAPRPVEPRTLPSNDSSQEPIVFSETLQASLRNSCLMPALWALQDDQPLYSGEPSEPPPVSPTTQPEALSPATPPQSLSKRLEGSLFKPGSWGPMQPIMRSSVTPILMGWAELSPEPSSEPPNASSACPPSPSPEIPPTAPTSPVSSSSTSTKSAYRKPPGKLSPKLEQMLKEATPEQVEQATAIMAKLLIRKAKRH